MSFEGTLRHRVMELETQLAALSAENAELRHSLADIEKATGRDDPEGYTAFLPTIKALQAENAELRKRGEEAAGLIEMAWKDGWNRRAREEGYDPEHPVMIASTDIAWNDSAAKRAAERLGRP